MSIESAIEKRIREAIARGEFDDLPGKGRPIDLNAYFNTPEELRMAHALLKSNDFVPAEVELMKEIAALREELRSADEEHRPQLIGKMNRKELELRLALERSRRNP